MTAMALVCAIVLGAGCINPQSASIGVFLNDIRSDNGTELINIGGTDYRTDIESLELSFAYEVIEFRLDRNKVIKKYENFDFSVLSRFKNLRYLYINDSNEIFDNVDLSFLPRLSKLETLKLYGISCGNYSPIAKCGGLRELVIRNDGFPQYVLTKDDVIFKLKDLEALSVDYIEIDAIDRLPELKRLNKISLANGFLSYEEREEITTSVPTSVQDTISLEEYQKLNEDGLQRLYEAVPNIQSLTLPILFPREAEIISRFSSLISLEFCNTVSDMYSAPDMLEGLSGLTGLKSLYIDLPCYYSLGFLRGMPNLEELQIFQYDADALLPKNRPDAGTTFTQKYYDNFTPLESCGRLKNLRIQQVMFPGNKDRAKPEWYPELPCIYQLSELEELVLDNVTVDLSKLSCADTLRTIDLLDGNITNTGILGSFHALENLTIHSCLVNNGTVLSGNEFMSLRDLRGLKELSIFTDIYTPSKIDMVFTDSMTKLESVSVRVSDIYNISGLRNSPDLRYLMLGNIDKREDFSFLNELSNITDLALQCVGGMPDVSFAVGLPLLSHLSLSGNFTELPDLSSLPNLSRLSIRVPYIGSLEGLNGCNVLYKLDILGCYHLYDASPIGGLTELTELKLDTLTISDISFLTQNENLSYLCLSDTENCYVGQCDISMCYDELSGESRIFEPIDFQYITTDFGVLKDIINRLSYFDYIGEDMSKEYIAELEALNPQCNIVSPLRW